MKGRGVVGVGSGGEVEGKGKDDADDDKDDNENSEDSDGDSDDSGSISASALFFDASPSSTLTRASHVAEASAKPYKLCVSMWYAEEESGESGEEEEEEEEPFPLPLPLWPLAPCAQIETVLAESGSHLPPLLTG